MSGPNISTGHITIKSSTAAPRQSSAGADFHILIIGDFSGRGSRQHIDINELATRKLVEVDRDNIEQVFSHYNIHLQLPISDQPIHFRELDDLHPDFLLANLELFNKFTLLKNRLKKPEQFENVLTEIQALNPQLAIAPLHQQTTTVSITAPASLEDILAGTQQGNGSAMGDMNQFIKNIVAPYAQAKADPRLPDMLDAVNNAMADTLRTLMHASAFQQLEAQWRGLDFLIRRLETNSKLKIFLLDASEEELRQDATQVADITQSSLYKRLVSSFQIAGKIPFSCIQANLTIADSLEDVMLAQALAKIAADIKAIAITAGSEKIAGCNSFAENNEVSDWHHPINEAFDNAWQQFRASDLSRHLALVAPRFLLRLPYGKKTSPIESFDFSELPTDQAHHYYLWGNSAHLITLILGQQYNQQGINFSTRIASEIDKLPLHAYQQDFADYIKPCAEIYILDAAVQRLNEAGILAIRSVYGKTSVHVPALRTSHLTGDLIFGQ